jgi:hypothetical protein
MPLRATCSLVSSELDWHVAASAICSAINLNSPEFAGGRPSLSILRYLFRLLSGQLSFT